MEICYRQSLPGRQGGRVEGEDEGGEILLGFDSEGQR